MQNDFYQFIAAALAVERLEAYRKQDQADECTTLARYLWNMALGEALYSPLQLCEVALRNSMHERLRCLFGDEWYISPTHPFPLTHWGGEKVESAIDVLKKHGKEALPGQVVAELSFGFWTHLMEDHYESNTAFMPKGIKYVLPNLPKSQHNRKNLKKQLDDIRLLRNRVFHHERICHWKDLKDKHDSILQVIGWCSKELKEMAESLDRFTAIHSEGIEPWKEIIRQHWPSETAKDDGGGGIIQ